VVDDKNAAVPVESVDFPPAARERYFLTYRGARLPLQLTEELLAESLGHRNTYFRAHYDAQDRMLCCEKLVYGEVELSHCAVITVGDEEPRTLYLPPHRAVP
jgi:hypothetical protein